MVQGRTLGALALATVGGVGLASTRWRPDCGCEGGEAAQVSSESLKDPIAPDPAIAKEGRLYVLFNTGRGIAMRTSKDLKSWGPQERVFATVPEWAQREVPGFRDYVWAPDVTRFGGRWHLYYAISTFGKNRSAIGHATNATLDPSRSDYKWVDQGAVLQSYPTDDYNAIDPNVLLDEKGNAWMAFGSFWGGLRIVRLDREGKVVPGERPRTLAFRPHEGPDQPGAIEAPFIVRHAGFYYLFASFDFCCRGLESTYNVRVGRSRAIDGPYVDREDKPMSAGGGTPLVVAGTRWKGPGGESVLRDGKTDRLVFHAYDAHDQGRAKLKIETLVWGRDGWPKAIDPG